MAWGQPVHHEGFVVNNLPIEEGGLDIDLANLILKYLLKHGYDTNNFNDLLAPLGSIWFNIEIC